MNPRRDEDFYKVDCRKFILKNVFDKTKKNVLYTLVKFFYPIVKKLKKLCLKKSVKFF